jgi:hypothetical protein
LAPENVEPTSLQPRRVAAKNEVRVNLHPVNDVPSWLDALS